MNLETGYLESSFASQQTRTNSFRFTSEISTLRVMARASTFNNFGYDVGEFYTNVVPKTNRLIITSSEPYRNETMRTIFNITTRNISES